MLEKLRSLRMALLTLLIVGWAFVLSGRAQTSDGTSALPNKAVDNQGYFMTDGASEFLNARSLVCPQGQSGFENGEVRKVKWGYDVFLGCSIYTDGSCDCEEGFINTTKVCDCQPISPIVIDLDGGGVKPTGRAAGVNFDLNSNGEKLPLPWTEGSSRDAWLVFDKHENGWIEDGDQLFGDQSPQAPAVRPSEGENGYRALRGFDDNKDNQITSTDGVWRLLGVWIDADHDGVSDAGEVLSLSNAGIAGLSLNYKESQRHDRFGNEFRYRADVMLTNGKKTFSWDVFLKGK